MFKNIRTSGIIAINLNEGDELLSVLITHGNSDIILGASNGKAIRFPESDMRDISRTAIGVRGMKLAEGDELVGVGLINSEEDEILVLTEKGYGKRSLASEYRCQGRGGQGVKSLNVTDKNGKMVALKVVSGDEDIIATTNRGMVIRCHIKGISQTGRATQGVIIMRIANNQTVATVAIVPHDIEEELEEAAVETINEENQTQVVEIPTEENQEQTE